MITNGQQREWRLAGVSVNGRRHMSTGIGCQDAHGWFVDGGLSAIAVADGAGSAPFSQLGSNLAVHAAWLSLLSQYRTGANLRNGELEVCLRSAMSSAAMAVEQVAEADGKATLDLATTLILVVAGPDFVGAAQVGDGAVIVGDSDLNLIALTTPQSGEYLNETHFITSPGAIQNAQISIRQIKLLHLAIFTDGLQMLGLQMPAARPHGPFFRPLFKYMESTIETEAAQGIGRFLKGRVAERSDDDLTLLLAHLPQLKL